MRAIEVTIKFRLTEVPDDEQTDFQAVICEKAEGLPSLLVDVLNMEAERKLAFDNFHIDTTETVVRRYINAYSVTRRFGGPEEGGWWYDEGMPLKSVEVADDQDADIEIQRQWAEFGPSMGFDPTTHERTSGRGRTSVIGDDDLIVIEEDGPAAAYPQQRPHYE